MNFAQRLLNKDFESRKRLRILGLNSTERSSVSNFRKLVPFRDWPLISVVLPVYNHANLVSGAIDSVLRQELPLELIIVNDGSTDNLDSEIAKYLDDRRVRYVTQPNGGIARALNNGFSIASGAFLTWTSADNLYLEDALRTLSNSLLEYPLTALTYGNVQLVNENNSVMRGSSYRPSDQVSGDGRYLSLPRCGELLFNFDDNFVNACFLYRKAYAEVAGAYSSELLGVEDYEYWLKMTAFSPAIHCGVERPLYSYRLHENSLTANLNAGQLQDLTRETRLRIERLRNRLDSEPLGQQISSVLKENSLIHSQILKRARDSDFKAIADNNKRFNVGIIVDPHDGKVDKLPSFETPDVEITAFFLAQNGVEAFREHALKSKISIFEDFPEDTYPLNSQEYLERSLMFFLSRTDFVISQNWTPDSLRLQAAIAASAGVELRAIRLPPDLFPEHEQKLLQLFLPAKHITFYDSFQAALDEDLNFDLSRRYFDEWLESQSSLGILQILRTAQLSSLLQKSP